MVDDSRRYFASSKFQIAEMSMTAGIPGKTQKRRQVFPIIKLLMPGPGS